MNTFQPTESGYKLPSDLKSIAIPAAIQKNAISKSPNNKSFIDTSIEHPKKGRKYHVSANFSSQSLSPLLKSKKFGFKATDKQSDTPSMSFDQSEISHISHVSQSHKGSDFLDVPYLKSKQSSVTSPGGKNKNEVNLTQQPTYSSIHQNTPSSGITPKSGFSSLSKNPSFPSKINHSSSQKSITSLNKSLDLNQNYSHDLNKFKAEMLREFRPFRRNTDVKASDLSENFENSHYLDQISKKQTEIMKKYASPFSNSNSAENSSALLKKQFENSHSPLLKTNNYKRNVKQNFNVEDSPEYREWAKSFKRNQAIDLKTGE